MYLRICKDPAHRCHQQSPVEPDALIGPPPLFDKQRSRRLTGGFIVSFTAALFIERDIRGCTQHQAGKKALNARHREDSDGSVVMLR